MKSIVFGFNVKLLLNNLRRFAVAAIGIAAVAVLVGCAHPISIEGKSVPAQDASWSQRKVAYVMSEADRQKQVTTQGGGGDKISYFPYRDFEKSLRSALVSVYSDVSIVSSEMNASAIRESGASFVFRPEITTTSSSSSAFTWPPTKFSVSVMVEVFDPKSTLLARLRATGNGNAEWEEFRGDFGLAGRRAVDDAARVLVDEVKRLDKLR